MQVNTKSLEDIVKKYLALAEERTESARQQSQQTADDVDDLDVLQTPERYKQDIDMLAFFLTIFVVYKLHCP